jgi:hypothetical protein
MNLNKLKSSVGTCFSLRPIPERCVDRGREQVNDEWQLQEVDNKKGTTLLSNLRTGHRLRLNSDHIHHYTSAPEAVDGMARGFLELTVLVVLEENEVRIDPLLSGPARAAETARALENLKRELGEQVAAAQVAAAKAKARTDKRILSAHGKVTFLKALVGFRGQRISVYHDARDAEAEGYAAMLSAALGEAGLGSGEYTGIDYDPRPEGVVVYCSDIRSPSPLPLGLVGGLRAAGVEAELSLAPGWARVDNPNWAGIWVGIKRCD